MLLCYVAAQTPQSQQMELRPPVSGVGTVVSGEASESDEESAAPLNLLPSLHGMCCLYFQALQH